MCFGHNKKTQEKKYINGASDGKLPFLVKEVIFLKKNKTKAVIRESSFPKMKSPLNEPNLALLVTVFW